MRNSNVPEASTTLTLTGLPPHTSVSIGFLLAIIDSWDGTGCFPTDDIFNVSVDGNPIFSETFVNHDTCGVQSYMPPAGVELAHKVDLGFNTGVYWFDSSYDMYQEPTFQNIPHTSSMLTVEWFTSGGGWQGGTDESWAIDKVVVLVDNIAPTGDPKGFLPSSATRQAWRLNLTWL